MRSERRVCFVFGSPDLPRGRREKAALKKAAGVSGGNDECQARLKGRQRNYWMGTEIGMLGGYGCQGQVTAGEVQTNKAKWEQDIMT